METKGELAKAIIKVMNEVSNIEKSMTVGSGNNSYKGVSDKDVKNIVGKSMAKNGLVMLPIKVDAKTTIERWEETNQYGTKMKQSVFAEAHTEYLLLHTSGESQVLAGFGHGVDSQDKASGKSLTYAMKGTILQTFMIPTGEIDDTDKTHSDDLPVPQKATVAAPQQPAPPKQDNLSPELLKVIEDIGKVPQLEAEIMAFASGLSPEMKANEKIKALLNKRIIEARKLVKA